MDEQEEKAVRQILLVILTLGLTVCFSGCATPMPQSWEMMHVDNSADELSSTVLCIRFVSRTHGWALTPNYLLETLDSGKTWIKRIHGDKERASLFEFLVFLDSIHMWIVGSQQCPSRLEGCGFVWGSADGGERWDRFEISMISGLHGATFCSRDLGWAVGSSASTKQLDEPKIVRTLNGGRIWTEQNPPPNINCTLLGITCFSGQEVLAVGTDGVILHTSDGGESWITRRSSVISTLFRVRFFGDHAWALGAAGTLLRSDDRGVTWKRVVLATEESLTDILMDGDRGWIVGENGTLLSSSNGGDSWNPEKSGTSSDLYSLSSWGSFVWVAGARLTVIRLALSD